MSNDTKQQKFRVTLTREELGMTVGSLDEYISQTNNLICPEVEERDAELYKRLTQQVLQALKLREKFSKLFRS